MFFGGGMNNRQNRHTQQYYQPRGQRQNHQQQRDPNEPPIMQAIRQYGPILFILFMSFITTFGESDSTS